MNRAGLLLCCLAVMGASPWTRADSATTALKPGPVGVVCLPPGNNPEHKVPYDLAGDPGWKNPEVKGFLIREFWPNLEPSEGKFEFGFLDQALALAKQNGKFLGISVCAGRASPEWIYAAGAQKFDFTRPGHMGGLSEQAHMPVPWDPAFQAKWGALNRELGRRYDGDPHVAYIVMTGAGRDFESFYVAQPGDVARFEQMDGYTNWAKAYIAIAENYAACFPHTTLIYALGPPTPGPAGHAALGGAVDKLLKEFPKQFGVCSAALAPRFNPTTPSGIYIRDEGPHRTVGFQMLLPSKGGTTMGGGSLRSALQLGVAYKAHYIEVYSSDCRDAQQATALQEANSGLAANARAAR